MTLGEALGFVLPSVATLAAVADGSDATGQFLAAVIAGAFQGAILGFAQAFATRRTPAALPMLTWIGATTVGATLAWSLGMIPGSFLALEAGAPVSIAILGVSGFLAVVVLPLSQWFVLRGTPLARSGGVWRWIPITVAAWSAGSVWLLSVSLLVNPETDLLNLIALYTVAGFLAVITIATITGLGMRWMLGSKRVASGKAARRAPKKAVPSRTL